MEQKSEPRFVTGVVSKIRWATDQGVKMSTANWWGLKKMVSELCPYSVFVTRRSYFGPCMVDLKGLGCPSDIPAPVTGYLAHVMSLPYRDEPGLGHLDLHYSVSAGENWGTATEGGGTFRLYSDGALVEDESVFNRPDQKNKP